MYVFFDDHSTISYGLVLSQINHNLLINTSTGKKVKIKNNAIIFSTENIILNITAEADKICQEADIDIELLWSSIPNALPNITEITSIYFGEKHQPQHKLAMLFFLQKNPIYFYKRSQGTFCRASREHIDAALLGQERRKKLEEKSLLDCETLLNNHLPESWGQHIDQLLFAPNPQGYMDKTLAMAAKKTGEPIGALLIRCQALSSEEAYHKRRFLYHNRYIWEGEAGFSRAHPIDLDYLNLPTAMIKAFSIDDITTTEIDDAFSCEWIDSSQVRIGIHIATPALGTPIDQSYLHRYARKRLSSIYLPGEKYTMFPEWFIKQFSLDAHTTKPCLSLYLTVDSQSWEIHKMHSCVEKIYIQENLRTPLWENLFNTEHLELPNDNQPWRRELKFLHSFSLHRKKIRTEKSNRPTLHYNQKPDFSFYLSETKEISIEQRSRQSPLNTIVSELMIETNVQWAEIMAQHQDPVTFSYRGIINNKIRLSLKASPHPSMGVNTYAWLTSPLRRYIDLLNQKQFIAKYVGIGEILSADIWDNVLEDFEVKYNSYDQIQNTMEKYWCLRWLQQTSKKIEAIVSQDQWAHLVQAPLSCRPAGLQDHHGINSLVYLTITHVNYWTLEFSAIVVHNPPVN